MNIRTGVGAALPLVGALLAAPAVAGDSAHDWLVKMDQAGRRLNYEGAFVYQHGDRLEAMRIVHKVANGSVRERLVALNGAAREIIRTEREVLCYLPDENSVVVEHRKADSLGFPAIRPERLPELEKYYQMRLGKTGRVAGRPAQVVIILARDGYRYGYRLWADQETGLPLKADLLADDEKTIEQFMFAHINIGVAIPASALAPSTPGKGLTWHRERAVEDSAAATQPERWQAGRLPEGFRLSKRLVRKVPALNKVVEHLVYSDGLATVSVFIEKPEPGARPEMLGPSRMGAVHAFGARVNDHHVTAVGEVPAATVALIGGSMAPLE